RSRVTSYGPGTDTRARPVADVSSACLPCCAAASSSFPSWPSLLRFENPLPPSTSLLPWHARYCAARFESGCERVEADRIDAARLAGVLFELSGERVELIERAARGMIATRAIERGFDGHRPPRLDAVAPPELREIRARDRHVRLPRNALVLVDVPRGSGHKAWRSYVVWRDM